MNWQPIETAPKDRRILLYYKDKLFNGIHCAFGRWEKEEWNKKPSPHWTHDLSHLSGRYATIHNQPTLWAEVELPKEDV